MDVKQIYSLTNDAVKSAIGETAVLSEDLTNLVDIGKEIINANATDKFTHALCDKVGKVVFVARAYEKKAPSVLMSSWEFGNILQKISAEMPEAIANDDWELTDGTTYSQDVFHQPKVSSKFFSQRECWEIDISLTTEQVKSAFNSATEMNGLISLIILQVQNSYKVRLDQMIMRTINNAIATTYNAEITGSTTTGVRAINLLAEYNTAMGTTLGVDKALYDLAFLKYASERILEVSDNMECMSKLFNVGGTTKFTNKDRQHIVLHSKFKRTSDVYLQSETYHNELTKLPASEGVAFWQGTGTNFEWDSTSKIAVKTASGDSVTIAHVLGTIFDREALGVSCLKEEVRSHYNAKADFTNYFYKFFMGYFNDFNENMVVFFIA